MGRTRTKSSKTRPPKQDFLLPSLPQPAPSVAALSSKAQNLIVQSEYPLALRFIQRILEIDPIHVEAREMLGVALLETGELGGAKEAFLSLIPPSPTARNPPPPSAYLYLAQLSDDDPHSALAHYQSAIDILNQRLKGKGRAAGGGDGSGDVEVKSTLVRALIGMVEIWMDPSYELCFDPNAEKTCDALLNAALQIDPGNAEALQTLASVRMSQERPDEAKLYLHQSWSKWKDLELDDPTLPPLPSRLSLVKLFLELSLYTPALLVLRGIMAADDQDVEAWYLEGWCFYLMAEQAREGGGTWKAPEEEEEGGIGWEELAKDARDCLETCQILHTNEGHPDKPLLVHVRELIGKLDSLGVKASPMAETDDAEEGGGWEDEDSDDEVSGVEMEY